MTGPKAILLVNHGSQGVLDKERHKLTKAGRTDEGAWALLVKHHICQVQPSCLAVMSHHSVECTMTSSKVLFADFIGSPRWHRSQLADVTTMVDAYGFPTFSLTLTADEVGKP